MTNTLNHSYQTILSGSSGILAFFFSLIIIIGVYKIFEKAGHLGIKAIIPLYNIYTLYKIAWGSGWIALLLIVPLVNIVVAIIHCFKLAKSFGQGGLFALGLLFLPFIFLPLLGFGEYSYRGPAL